MLENKFKTKLSKEIKTRFPGAMVLHLDPNEIQGIPDLIILYGKHWMTLEGKKSARASKRPNQEYYVNEMNKMSFSRFVCPENKDDVLNDIEDFIRGGE